VRVQTEKTQAKQERAQTETSIFEAIQGGATTVAGIFAQLGGSVDIDTISKFLEDITPESAEGFKFSATQNASLLGTGMNLGDIRALSSYISENGYTEEVRGMLTPTEKLAVDKIFREQPKATGGETVKPRFKFSNDKVGQLLGAGFLEEDIPALEESLRLYGMEATLSAIEDPNQRLALATMQGGTEILSQVEAEPPTIEETTTSIVDSLNSEQLKTFKTMADTRGLSKIRTGKKKDVTRMLETPEVQAVIQRAMDQNMSTEDIIAALLTP